MRLRFLPTVLVVLFFAASVWAFNAQDLLDDLKNQTGQKQLDAALRLGDYTQYPDVVTALSAKLDDANADVILRAACAGSLGKCTDKSVYPMLKTLANKADEKAVVRKSCVEAMAGVKRAEAIGDLVEMLKTEQNLLVKMGVEVTLAKMNEPERVAIAVSPLLKDENAAPAAIRVLGSVGGPSVIGPLAKELDSPKAGIRLAVIRALGSIAHPNSVPPLLAFYPKANDAEKVQILSAFSSQPHAGALKLMMGELENPKTYPAIRRSAALSLGNVVAKPAINLLVKITLDTTEDEGLRLTCVQALGKFGDHDDYAIAGLIGALADKKLAEAASISLSRITRRYFGTSKEKWTDWFQEWRQVRDRNAG
jgi:HEAT repeat protein